MQAQLGLAMELANRTGAICTVSSWPRSFVAAEWQAVARGERLSAAQRGVVAFIPSKAQQWKRAHQRYRMRMQRRGMVLQRVRIGPKNVC